MVKQKQILFRVIALPVLAAGLSLGTSTGSVAAATIKYNLNGVAPTVYTAENAKVVANVVPDFDNMAFTGWNTQPGGSGTSYKAGDSIGGDAILYAQWQDGTHLKDWVKPSTGGNAGETKDNDTPVTPIEPAKPDDKGDDDDAGKSDDKSSNKSDNNSKASGVIGVGVSESGPSNGMNSDGSSSNANSNTGTGSLLPSAGLAGRLAAPGNWLIVGLLGVTAVLLLTSKPTAGAAK